MRASANASRQAAGTGGPRKISSASSSAKRGRAPKVMVTHKLVS